MKSWKKAKHFVKNQIYNTKCMLRAAILFSLILLFFLSSVFESVNALTMSDSNYVLELGTLNSGAGISTSSNNKLNISLGQLGPGFSTSSNFQLKAGFQYIYSIIPFTFSIDNTLIDFGIVSPTFPVTRSNNLTVGNGSANGYQVTAYEDHQLLYAPSGAFIPNTTCDAASCNTITAGSWTSSTTYGFGYNCINSETPTRCGSGFATSSTIFKSFADNSLSQTPQIVMQATTSNTATSSASVQITYKLNISGTQTAGVYKNNIYYVATPLY